MNRRKPDEIPFKMDNLATWLLRASENNTESAIIDGEVSR